MSNPDSMFLFEIVVEELKSCTACKEFYIKSKFADVFSFTLKDPNIVDPLIPTVRKRTKKRSDVRDDIQEPPPEGKLQSGHSILFSTPINSLITAMKNHPIELTLFNKDDRCGKIGSVQIPWSPIYIEYLNTTGPRVNTVPIRMRGGHNVYDDMYKRVATIVVNTKLTHLKDKVASFRSSTTAQSTKIRQNRINSSLTTSKDSSRIIIQDSNTIKTYNDGKRKKKLSHRNNTQGKESTVVSEENMPNVSIMPITHKETVAVMQNSNLRKAPRLFLAKSATYLNNGIDSLVAKTKSCSFLDRKKINFLNYVFGDFERPLGNQVYCVGYFTVENVFNAGSSSKESSPRESSPLKSSLHGSSPHVSPTRTDSSKAFGAKSSDSDGSNRDCAVIKKSYGKERYAFRKCDDDCTRQENDGECDEIVCLKSSDDPDATISITKCDRIRCDDKEMRKLPPPPPDTIFLDMSNKDCCKSTQEAIEQVVGGMKANMKFDEKSCYCECECTFGFVKHTTYCGVCGGYERAGEDMTKKILNAPFPCPIYHKLFDKNKLKASSSDMCDDSKRKPKPPPPPPPKVEVESDREYCRKKRKEKRDDRFKFNYGYTAPQIGHSRCGLPCTGTLNAVPKNMGWLWTADNVPGMKFRPSWKPGCVHKHVYRLLRMAKDPGMLFAKKKKKVSGKPKKPIKRPLITVAKKDGEYTVTMETMKNYSRPRALNQQPYEDRPVVTYTIGRTEEENLERKKRKEREFRRLQRDQRDFIQSAFTDMCKEICLKTYQQALGILPDTEDPDCPCYPQLPGPDDTNVNRSCSCSEDDVSFGTDSDSDEWFIEFTPPNAHFDPTYKPKKITKVEKESQYNYLDYKVKLLDFSGNPVPRFFKGPNGKTECSDLGGFWSPDHKWLEINVDGFIAPDGKWAPVVFVGPRGDNIDCETGKFQDIDGTWLVVGVDGYIDATGHWKFYPRSKSSRPRKESDVKKGVKGKADVKAIDKVNKTSDTAWSCFGDANPRYLSKLGILGHGQDKRLLLKTINEMIARGENLRVPEVSMVPKIPGSRKHKGGTFTDSYSFYSNRTKCKHPLPSEKGIVAVDGYGNKTYFRLKDYKNARPNERFAKLTKQGISLSSFHVPCLSSFINAEMMKKQQYERFLKNQSSRADMEYGVSGNKNAATQYRYRYAI